MPGEAALAARAEQRQQTLRWAHGGCCWRAGGASCGAPRSLCPKLMRGCQNGVVLFGNHVDAVSKHATPSCQHPHMRLRCWPRPPQELPGATPPSPGSQDAVLSPAIVLKLPGAHARGAPLPPCPRRHLLHGLCAGLHTGPAGSHRAVHLPGGGTARRRVALAALPAAIELYIFLAPVLPDVTDYRRRCAGQPRGIGTLACDRHPPAPWLQHIITVRTVHHRFSCAHT